MGGDWYARASLRCFWLNLRADSSEAEDAEGNCQASSERRSQSSRAGFGCDGCNAALVPGNGTGGGANAILGRRLRGENSVPMNISAIKLAARLLASENA